MDVETINSWESNTANNVTDLEGMTAYFQNIGATVGIYSTSYQWGQITGFSIAPDSNLNGLTPGSKVTATQFVHKQTDYDYSCI